MKITIYELLGLIKDGKAPKKIKYKDKIWECIPTIHGRGYQYYSEYYQDYRTLQNQVYLEECLNDEIEIIEEPKNIEKLELESGKIDDKEFLAKYITHNRYKINELIDEINNLKEK
jgi:hypothetical protein|nr:MAG TPA: hypothetical protein [Caudoviricetes sp.]